MRVSWRSVAFALLLVAVLAVLVSSSAAFKFSPRASKSSAAATTADEASDEVEDVLVSAAGGKASSASGLERKKTGISRDYVFAKVNNPKLVRPKNSRIGGGGGGGSEEDDEDEREESSNENDNDINHDVGSDDDDDGDDGGDVEEDSAESRALRKSKSKNAKTTLPMGQSKIKRAPQDDRENAADGNSARINVDEEKEKNKKGKKTKQRATDDQEDQDDDDDEDQVVVVVADKSKKKIKSKQSDDDEDGENEREKTPSRKSKKKEKKDDEDNNDDDDDEQPKNKSKSKVRDEDDDDEPKKKSKSKSKEKDANDDDVDDDGPKKRSKSKDKDEDGDDEPKRKSKSKVKDREDDEESSPKKKSKKKKSGKEMNKKGKDTVDDDDDNSHWWNFFGYFNQDKDEEGFLELIQKKRDEENAKILTANEKVKKKQDAEEKEAGKSWLSYLNRKPFNYLFNFDFDDAEEQSEDEKRDTEPEKGGLDMKKEKKRSGPLSTDDFEEILAYIPSFVPNYTSIENIDCRRQGQIFHRQLRGQKLWAFQMIDAGGKIGSGILHGNINQLGNFDLCTDISTKVKITEDTMVRVKGKYCLAHLDIQATDESLKYLMHLINGKSLLRSTINDPSHFVPRFTTFNWGVCVPAACTVEDVQEFLEASLEDYNSTGIRLNIEIDEENCHVAQKFHWDKLIKEKYEIVVILACVSSVLAVVILATLNQCWTHWRSANIVIEILDGGENVQREEEELMISLNGAGGEPEPGGLLNSLILQFSLKGTWSQLTAVKEGEIECLHGIKAFASIGLFFILKVLQLIRAPYANRVDLTEILNSSWTLILRSPLLFMDVFLILTGFLASYSLLKRYEETGRFHVICSVLGKLIRMLPLVALATLFQAHIWRYLGSGPQWNEIVGTHAKLCEETWWKNLMFIQTTDKIEDACDPISYQFTVQMGLFLVSPLIVWAMIRKPNVALGIFGAVNALSVAMRFSQTQSDRLAPIFYHGIKMTQIYRTMDMDHGSIIHRATPFINGLGLGFVLLQYGKKVKVPRSSNIALWTLSILGLVWCLFSQTHVTQRDYIYDAVEMAQVAAWVPLIWSYSIMWIIFACYSGNGRYVNKFLSSKPLVFISRIAFALHFVQYIVLSSNSAKTRAVGHFEVSHFVNTFELCVILLVSVFLTLTFDLPMQNVRDLLKNWEWSSEAEVKAEEKDSPAAENEPKRSTEALFKSNGKLDSSHFDWNEKKKKEESMEREENSPPRGRLGSFNNHRGDGDEHLDAVGNEEEYEEEEEDEEELSGEMNEGGNSAPIHEQVDDIWGSDNE